MPNGYDWLSTTRKTTHSWEHWVIHTGEATDTNFESALREPSTSESLLIDLVLNNVDFATTLPFETYNSVKFCETLKTSGSFIWSHKEGEKGVSASVYECADGSVKWLDAIPIVAGVETNDSFLIVVATSLLGAPQKSVCRMLYSVESKLAVRKIVDTVVSVPTFQQWDGSFNESALLNSAHLAQETAQRSLVQISAYSSSTKNDAMWTELVDGKKLKEDPEYYEQVTSETR